MEGFGSTKLHQANACARVMMSYESQSLMLCLRHVRWGTQGENNPVFRHEDCKDPCSHWFWSFQAGVVDLNKLQSCRWYLLRDVYAWNGNTDDCGPVWRIFPLTCQAFNRSMMPLWTNQGREGTKWKIVCIFDGRHSNAGVRSNIKDGYGWFKFMYLITIISGFHSFYKYRQPPRAQKSRKSNRLYILLSHFNQLDH